MSFMMLLQLCNQVFPRQYTEDLLDAGEERLLRLTHLTIFAVTAFGFLETLRVPEGEYLLQSAAGSAIGRVLIALAKQRGVKSINLVRRREQVKELLDLG